MITNIQFLPTSVDGFPYDEVKSRLRCALEKVAEDSAVLRPAWEPLLDSQRVVGTVLVVEDLFPAFKISPDKVVRKGGYSSVDEAVHDVVCRLERAVANHNPKKGRT